MIIYYILYMEETYFPLKGFILYFMLLKLLSAKFLRRIFFVWLSLYQ